MGLELTTHSPPSVPASHPACSLHNPPCKTLPAKPSLQNPACNPPQVSKSGSVVVEKLMEIERYSHVMHISSTVTGQLQPGLDSWDALRAALPAGTVSGAPKVGVAPDSLLHGQWCIYVFIGVHQIWEPS
jgi:hypothetical protein